MVEFSVLLVSIKAWLFEFAEKQANMASTHSFTIPADSAMGKGIYFEAETFQAVTWSMSSMINSTLSTSTHLNTQNHNFYYLTIRRKNHKPSRVASTSAATSSFNEESAAG